MCMFVRADTPELELQVVVTANVGTMNGSSLLTSGLSLQSRAAVYKHTLQSLYTSAPFTSNICPCLAKLPLS